MRIYSADPDATPGAGSVGIPSPPDFKRFKHSTDSTFEVGGWEGDTWKPHLQFWAASELPIVYVGIRNKQIKSKFSISKFIEKKGETPFKNFV